MLAVRNTRYRPIKKIVWSLISSLAVGSPRNRASNCWSGYVRYCEKAALTASEAAEAWWNFTAEYILGSKGGELMKRDNGADSPNCT